MNPLTFTERARAERLLDELEADAKTLRAQLEITCRSDVERNFTPLYFDKLQQARWRMQEALDWSYRPHQKAASG